MFQIGEHVIYGNNGVCKIEDIKHLDIAGVDKKKLYYCLTPVNNEKCKIYSAVDQERVVIRKTMTKEEILNLIDSVPEMEAEENPLWAEDDKLRESNYKKAMHSCDCKELFRLIRAMYFRKQQKTSQGRKVTATEEHYLKEAEEKLYNELAFVLKTDQNKLVDFIGERVRKQASHS